MDSPTFFTSRMKPAPLRADVSLDLGNCEERERKKRGGQQVGQGVYVCVHVGGRGGRRKEQYLIRILKEILEFFILLEHRVFGNSIQVPAHRFQSFIS